METEITLSNFYALIVYKVLFTMNSYHDWQKHIQIYCGLFISEIALNWVQNASGVSYNTPLLIR